MTSRFRPPVRVAALCMAFAVLSAGDASAAERKSLPPTAEPSAREAAEIDRIARPRRQALSSRPAALGAPSGADTATEAAATGGGAPEIRRGTAGTGTPSRQSFMPGFRPRSGRGDVAPENYGRGNGNTIYQYTDLKVPDAVSDDHPYRAAGYFTFKASDGNWYWCTASLISNSILVTAGHCVHDGGNKDKGWIRQGYFYPARSKDRYPYGRAKVREVFTTDGWYDHGRLDRGYDVGLVVLDTRGNTGREIGRDTGTLAFCHKNCLSKYAFLSGLGYPSNYYKGEQMSEGHHLAESDRFDFAYGSGMQGGSSGGPQVANLGVLDAKGGGAPERNVVFAVTSWGYIDKSIMIQGASSLSGPNNENGFKGMFNDACAAARRLHGKNSCDPL